MVFNNKLFRLNFTEDMHYWVVRLIIIIVVCLSFLVFTSPLEASLALVFVLAAITHSHFSFWDWETSHDIASLSICIGMAGLWGALRADPHILIGVLVFANMLLLAEMISRYLDRFS